MTIEELPSVVQKAITNMLEAKPWERVVSYRYIGDNNIELTMADSSILTMPIPKEEDTNE